MKVEKDPLQNLPLGISQKNKTSSSSGKSTKPDLENDEPAPSNEAAKVKISGLTQGAAAEMSVKEAITIAQKTAAAITQKTETASFLHHPVSGNRAEELIGS